MFPVTRRGQKQRTRIGRHVLLTLAFLAAACTKADYRAEEDSGVQQVGSWLVVCMGGEINAVGQTPIKKHCRLEDAGDVWDTKNTKEPIVRVDEAGAYVIDGRRVWEPPCRWKPEHTAVDSVSFGGLTNEQKINAMRAGKIFARETQAVWPYCWIEIEETPLEGFGEAYDLMMARWAIFREI